MKDDQEQELGRSRGTAADPRAHAQMGFLLRQVYGTVITEPVPDRFSQLLEKLAQKTGAEQVSIGAGDLPAVHPAKEAP